MYTCNYAHNILGILFPYIPTRSCILLVDQQMVHVFLTGTFRNLFFVGIVGEIGESKDEYYIWTHKKFEISYNKDQIVDVSLTSESKTKLTPNSKISFTYEVC